jgi:hypothetical protein
MPLTAANRRKIEKIKALGELVGMAFWNAEKETDEDSRRMMLEFSEDYIVRGGVIGKYVLIDELLTNVIAAIFSSPRRRSRSYGGQRSSGISCST